MSNENKTKWFKILADIASYAIAAILGGIGVAVSGCACVPVFDF